MQLRRLPSLPAELIFVITAVSLYTGAGFAVGLFDDLGPITVAWLRISTAAIVLLAWRRPTAVGRSRARTAITFGLITTAMNTVFYLSVDQLPLGTAVAIEFMGPVAVAAGGARTPRSIAALLCTTCGVVTLAGIEIKGSPAGVAFALTAAVLWALHVVWAGRVAAAERGIDDLAIGLAAGALALGPIALAVEPSAMSDAFGRSDLLMVGALVGLLSSVVPYGLDQVTMPILGPHRFALMLAILPATAAALGALQLGQRMSAGQLVGIALVTVGVAASGRARTEHLN